MSLKKQFVPKSDVKQWFTNTTTGHNKHISLTSLKPTGKNICQSEKPLFKNIFFLIQI